MRSLSDRWASRRGSSSRERDSSGKATLLVGTIAAFPGMASSYPIFTGVKMVYGIREKIPAGSAL